MENEFGLVGRNGKQCRERYHNHLEDGIIKEPWKVEEEELLVKLHGEHGNRWALISKLIPGRTDNCVKNMLYSRLRKNLRQLNRIAHQAFHKAAKPVSITFIHRLIEVAEGAYQQPSV